MTDQDVTPYPGVSKRRDSTQWQWAIVVPQDLKDHYGGAKFAHRCSLRTSNLRDANRRAAHLRTEWDKTFDSLRKARNAQPSALTLELAQAIAAELTRWVLQADDNARDFPEFAQALVRARNRKEAATRQGTQEWRELADVLPPSTFSRLVIDDGSSGAAEAPTRDPLEGLTSDERDALTVWNAEGLHTASQWTAGRNLRAIQPLADSVARSMGHAVDWTESRAREALLLCLESLRRASEATTARDKGQPIPTPSASTQSPSMAPSAPNEGHTVMDAYEAWARRKPNRLPKTFKTYRTAALKLAELLQGRSLESLTREDGRKVTAALQQEAAERGPSAINTAATQLSRFTTLLAEAVDIGWIDRNPLEGRGRDIETVKASRGEWTAKDLAALCGQPLFTAYDLPTVERAGMDAAYWLPLLGLYTGARVSELAQLRTADVSSKDGLWQLGIVHDPAAGMRTKTREGRDIPLHPELIRLGFLDYVAAMRDMGCPSLWPALRRSLDNGAGGPFSSWFGRFKKGLGLPDSVTFHGFRHTVETRLRAAGASQAHIDHITGHASSTGSKVSNRYAHLKAVDVAPTMELLKFPCLNLSRVFDAPRRQRP